MQQQRIGRYQVLEDIAVGGQGAVYKAIDPLIDRIVAIKVLKPELTSDGGYLERFYREAALAAQIDHPNVVKIHDMGEDDGRHFIVMEYLPRTLADLIPHDKGLPIDRVLELGGQIAQGLAAAHARGITHRDVKPQNVLITQDGDAKVTDFGIARAETFTTMTLSGAIIGTPHYMSPEQARGTRVDVRSDVYSLGCVIYEMLTGNLPFSGTTPYEVFRQHVEEQPRSVRQLRREVPRELAGVVERAMEKDPEYRYQSAGDFAEAIRSVTAGVGRQTQAAIPVAHPSRPVDAPPTGAGPGVPARAEAAVTSGTRPKRKRKPLAILGVASLIVVAVTIVIAAIVQSSGSGTTAPPVTPGIASESPQTLAVAAAAPTPAPTAQAASPSLPATPITPITAAPAAPTPTSSVFLPSGESPSGKIAFASTRDGNFEIYVMNADGSNQVRLTNNPADDMEPSWSPDGSKIAFLSWRVENADIYVMNADGSNQVNLSQNPGVDGQPSWSPDGSKIAFISFRNADSDIYVMNADGSNQINLTNNSSLDLHPSWSSDGTKLTFESDRDGNLEIYVMNADGSNQVNITNNPEIDLRPVWSTDSSKIAFNSIRDGNWEIYSMDADGSNQVRLTNNPARDQQPVWSPDGSKIAFKSKRNGKWDVYVMNADGSNQFNLTEFSADETEPSWSADGSFITFVSDRYGTAEIYVINNDGSNQIRSTSNYSDDLEPSWSPVQ